MRNNGSRPPFGASFIGNLLPSFHVLWIALVGAFLLAGCSTPVAEKPAMRIGKWTVFEQSFSSARVYTTNAYSVQVDVHFLSNGGREMVIPATYLGGQTWQVRFVPNEVGRWSWRTDCSDKANPGLHDIKGEFYCTAPNQLGSRNTPPLDDPAVRAPYFIGLFNNPASDLGEAGNQISPSAKGQVTPLFEALTKVEFWRLHPCSDQIVQPSKSGELGRRVPALKSDSGDFLLAYTPGERSVAVMLQAIPKNCRARWLNPRTGAAHPAIGVVNAGRIEFPTPEPGDWFLELVSGK